MTCEPERARKVSGWTNSHARFVIPTLTVQPARWSPRSTSAALYAAIPPLIPNAPFLPLKLEKLCKTGASWRSDLREIKDQCNIAETRAQRRLIEGLIQSRQVSIQEDKRLFLRESGAAFQIKPEVRTMLKSRLLCTGLLVSFAK